jgi:putative sigma-54 modulation protein
MDRAEVHFTEQPTKRITEKEICEVTLVGHGHHVRCKVAAADGFAAVDAAVEKLEHQLHKLKTRLKKRSHGVRRSGVSAASIRDLPGDVLVEDDEVDAGPRIVKTKVHDLKPMTTEEAMLQLEMVDHDFFLFTNADTGRAAVLYRRSDGDLGLIDQAV